LLLDTFHVLVANGLPTSVCSASLRERLLKQFRLQRFFRGLDDAYAAISPAACSYPNSRHYTVTSWTNGTPCVANELT